MNPGLLLRPFGIGVVGNWPVPSHLPGNYARPSRSLLRLPPSQPLTVAASYSTRRNGFSSSRRNKIENSDSPSPRDETPKHPTTAGPRSRLPLLDILENCMAILALISSLLGLVLSLVCWYTGAPFLAPVVLLQQQLQQRVQPAVASTKTTIMAITTKRGQGKKQQPQSAAPSLPSRQKKCKEAQPDSTQRASFLRALFRFTWRMIDLPIRTIEYLLLGPHPLKNWTPTDKHMPVPQQPAYFTQSAATARQQQTFVLPGWVHGKDKSVAITGALVCCAVACRMAYLASPVKPFGGTSRTKKKRLSGTPISSPPRRTPAAPLEANPLTPAAATTSPSAPDVFAQLVEANDFPALSPPTASNLTWQMGPSRTHTRTPTASITQPPAPASEPAAAHTEPPSASTVFGHMFGLPALSPPSSTADTSVTWHSGAITPPAVADGLPASAMQSQKLAGSCPALSPPSASHPDATPHTTGQSTTPATHTCPPAGDVFMQVLAGSDPLPALQPLPVAASNIVWQSNAVVKTTKVLDAQVTAAVEVAAMLTSNAAVAAAGNRREQAAALEAAVTPATGADADAAAAAAAAGNRREQAAALEAAVTPATGAEAAAAAAAAAAAKVQEQTTKANTSSLATHIAAVAGAKATAPMHAEEQAAAREAAALVSWNRAIEGWKTVLQQEAWQQEIDEEEEQWDEHAQPEGLDEEEETEERRWQRWVEEEEEQWDEHAEPEGLDDEEVEEAVWLRCQQRARQQELYEEEQQEDWQLARQQEMEEEEQWDEHAQPEGLQEEEAKQQGRQWHQIHEADKPQQQLSTKQGELVATANYERWEEALSSWWAMLQAQEQLLKVQQQQQQQPEEGVKVEQQDHGLAHEQREVAAAKAVMPREEQEWLTAPSQASTEEEGRDAALKSEGEERLATFQKDLGEISAARKRDEAIQDRQRQVMAAATGQNTEEGKCTALSNALLLLRENQEDEAHREQLQQDLRAPQAQEEARRVEAQALAGQTQLVNAQRKQEEAARARAQQEQAQRAQEAAQVQAQEEEQGWRQNEQERVAAVHRALGVQQLKRDRELVSQVRARDLSRARDAEDAKRQSAIAHEQLLQQLSHSKLELLQRESQARREAKASSGAQEGGETLKGKQDMLELAQAKQQRLQQAQQLPKEEQQQLEQCGVGHWRLNAALADSHRVQQPVYEEGEVMYDWRGNPVYAADSEQQAGRWGDAMEIEEQLDSEDEGGLDCSPRWSAGDEESDEEEGWDWSKVNYWDVPDREGSDDEGGDSEVEAEVEVESKAEAVPAAGKVAAWKQQTEEGAARAGQGGRGDRPAEVVTGAAKEEAGGGVAGKEAAATKMMPFGGQAASRDLAVRDRRLGYTLVTEALGRRAAPSPNRSTPPMPHATTPSPSPAAGPHSPMFPPIPPPTPATALPSAQGVKALFPPIPPASAPGSAAPTSQNGNSAVPLTPPSPPSLTALPLSSSTSISGPLSNSAATSTGPRSYPGSSEAVAAEVLSGQHLSPQANAAVQQWAQALPMWCAIFAATGSKINASSSSNSKNSSSSSFRNNNSSKSSRDQSSSDSNAHLSSASSLGSKSESSNNSSSSEGSPPPSVKRGGKEAAFGRPRPGQGASGAFWANKRALQSQYKQQQEASDARAAASQHSQQSLQQQLNAKLRKAQAFATQRAPPPPPPPPQTRARANGRKL